VISRYQAAATSSSGIGWKITACDVTLAPEQVKRERHRDGQRCVLSWPMNSFPVGGMITRIACGNTVRRMVSNQDMPSAVDASDWPSGTELMPARMISAR